jgi:uncharacterized membrane protein YdjX (TVP38/TMEM64 family)
MALGLTFAQSIQAVKLWQFVFATFCVLPKILLETFIGSKMAELSDGKQRGHMDTSKVIRGLKLFSVFNMPDSHKNC